MSPVELPTKKGSCPTGKDRLSHSNGPAGETADARPVRNSFGFAVLDQSETCNILLARNDAGYPEERHLFPNRARIFASTLKESSDTSSYYSNRWLSKLRSSSLENLRKKPTK
jgi:hypothetical protein